MAMPFLARYSPLTCTWSFIVGESKRGVHGGFCGNAVLGQLLAADPHVVVCCWGILKRMYLYKYTCFVLAHHCEKKKT